MNIILIYVTHKDMKSAEEIVTHLLTAKLIACANFLPIKSSYHWKGKIENSDEVVSILKTKKENWGK